MIPKSPPPVDARDVNALLKEFETRRHGYLPQWSPPTKSAGAAIGPIFARLVAAILQRLNQAPAKFKLAFLDLLGLRLVPAQPARAPIVFTLTDGAPDTSASEGTQVAAPPPLGSSQQVVFSTVQDAAVAAAKLTEIVSLWPGRDQYINHSAALAAAKPFTLFQHLQLKATDHILYLAHSKFLALAGTARLKVTFDLAQASSTPLDLVWEYWDGQVWRGFIPNQATCLDPVETGSDGTNGLSASGSVQLEVQGAQAAQTSVNGVTSYWIRARLAQPLLPDPNQILPQAESVRLFTVIEQDFEPILKCSFAPPSVSKILVQDSIGDPLQGITVEIVLSTAESGTGYQATTDSLGLAVLSQPFTPGLNYTVLITSPQSSGSFTPTVQYQNFTLTANSGNLDQSSAMILSLTNESGSGLAGVAVSITNSDNSFTAGGATDANGNLAVLQQLTPGDTYIFTVTAFGRQATASAVYPGTAGLEIDLIFSLQGLRVDKAYAEGKPLDVTKAFLPFGQLPQLGSAFYFKQAEAFSKPGALVEIFVNAIVPDALPANATPFTHVILWEYWNGYDWVPLLSPNSGSDFTTIQSVQFTVPQDMRSVKVNNEDGLWVRVRIAGGKYGYEQTLQLPSPSTPPTVSFPVIQAPVLADFRVSYKWQNGPFPFEQVFTCNDFQFIDRTANALWLGNPFPPYQLVGDVTPAVYFGFNKQLPVNNFGIYLDIAEQTNVTEGPALIWEYWNGAGWFEVVAEDETQDLALPGMITFIPAADAQPLARFDIPLHWLRGRLKEDGSPEETTINRIYTNAVWAAQWQSYTNSPLGVSTGVPNQIFQFNQIPILPGQEIDVQELSGPRANTEWRGLAMQVAPDDPNIVTELEALLAAEGPQTDIIVGHIHLVRDKTKSVTAVWIQWEEEQNFFESGPNDRYYVLDHALGRLFFGSGDLAMIPPLGALIQATSFRSGGGLVGNVPAGTITQLLGAVSGVQGVTNPRAGEGGADGETLEQFQQRAPYALRDRGRAIVPQDYEALAQEASAGVAVARAFPTLNPSGIAIPGWVTVIIIPQSKDPRPMPSAGLRQDVRDYLLARAPFDVAAAGGINVVAPNYLAVDVAGTIAPVDPAEAGTVEQNALDALGEFFNPLTGGPGGNGWDVGRGVHISDVAAVLGDVAGVDYVQELAVYVNGVLQGDEVQVLARQVVVAGHFKLSVVLPVGA